MSVFIHPNALCESKNVGPNTRIWAFAHILPDAVIGQDCNICDHVFIENDVRIGDRVTVKCGVQLWDGISIEDDVFIGPNATFTNDPYPRSRQRPDQFPATRIEVGASIGANATILPGLTIGQKAMIGAGAVITHDVPPGAIVIGNPGRVVGYEGAKEVVADGPSTDDTTPQITTSDVRGVTLHRFPKFVDSRGSLSVCEFPRDLPFLPQRYYLVYAVPGKDVRGEHAHRVCAQFMVCISGSMHIVADDGRSRQEFVMDSPTLGVYLPPMTWGIQYKYSADAVMLALASHAYDADDYIREYDEFLAQAN